MKQKDEAENCEFQKKQPGNRVQLKNIRDQDQKKEYGN
jgi:hypothetical protein